MNESRRYLNVGCGARFHTDWVNIDIAPADPSVARRDIRGGIAFPGASFDVVYHSHVLEHLDQQAALRFLKECHRVLKPGGIIRIAVPDLERIARTYLLALERAIAGDEPWADHYNWILLEMYDQAVRERSGGRMAEYLEQPTIPNLEFVLERMGVEGKRIVAGAAASGRPTGTRSRFGRRARRLLALVRPGKIRERIIRLILGNEYELLEIGRFRRRGEVHVWMYDRYSLSRLLLAAGFQGSQPVGADQSLIPNWANFHLDTEPDGSVYKPDSLFMEAVKSAGVGRNVDSEHPIERSGPCHEGHSH